MHIYRYIDIYIYMYIYIPLELTTEDAQKYCLANNEHIIVAEVAHYPGEMSRTISEMLNPQNDLMKSAPSGLPSAGVKGKGRDC